MLNTVLDKTEKGRNEIATRSHHLASRLRTLLLLIDGKAPTDHLLKTVSGLGMTNQHLQELIDQGFVTSRVVDNAVVLETLAGNSEVENSAASLVLVPVVSEESAPGATQGTDVVAQIQAVHQFYNETIKAYIGLRGIGLQLKVERAATLEDYRALRQPYLDAIRAQKGEDVALSLDVKLQAVLFAGQSPASAA